MDDGDASEGEILASPPEVDLSANLFEVMESETPPSTNWFESLPSTILLHVWGVYVVVLRRNGHKPLLYIGSGTATRRGVRARLNQYDNDVMLPHYRCRERSIKSVKTSNIDNMLKGLPPRQILSSRTRCPRRYLTSELERSWSELNYLKVDRWVFPVVVRRLEQYLRRLVSS